MRPHGVLETALYVDDLDAAEAFYRTVLGLQTHSRVEGRNVFMRCGRGMLLLFRAEATLSPDSPAPLHGACGPGHTAFAIHEREVPCWRTHLRVCGVKIEREITWPAGGTSLYFRDPAGNSLEVASPAIWQIPEDA